ncbi:hypothetical protein D3C81_1492210 [compost metagenome]
MYLVAGGVTDLINHLVQQGVEVRKDRDGQRGADVPQTLLGAVGDLVFAVGPGLGGLLIPVVTRFGALLCGDGGPAAGRRVCRERQQDVAGHQGGQQKVTQGHGGLLTFPAGAAGQV